MIQLIKDYGFPIDWSVASLFVHDRFVLRLIDVLKKLDYPNPIKYVFGSTPCLFAGGQISPLEASCSTIKSIFEDYNGRGVGCRLTLSNPNITEDGLDDSLSNEILSILNDISSSSCDNGVFVCSDLLARHIRTHYPKLQVIASIVKAAHEFGLDKVKPSDFRDFLDFYDRVHINPALIRDSVSLSELKEPYRYLIAVNARNVPNDPLADKYFTLVSDITRRSLSHLPFDEELNQFKAIVNETVKIQSYYPFASLTYSQSDIEELGRRGFDQFLIVGREYEDITFLRDLGDYIFVPHMFMRLATAIMQRPI